jgi:hypothetical protein
MIDEGVYRAAAEAYFDAGPVIPEVTVAALAKSPRLRASVESVYRSAYALGYAAARRDARWCLDTAAKLEADLAAAVPVRDGTEEQPREEAAEIAEELILEATHSVEHPRVRVRVAGLAKSPTDEQWQRINRVEELIAAARVSVEWKGTDDE